MLLLTTNEPKRTAALITWSSSVRRCLTCLICSVEHLSQALPSEGIETPREW